MSAAAARRTSPSQNQNSSPTDSKKTLLKTEDQDAKDPKSANDVEASQSMPSRSRPTTTTDTPDYFSSVHNTFSFEPNPFEQSFSNPSAETPGKSLLPPVAAITSPALAGSTSSGGFPWANSLRAGPLSPAMLAGPAGSGDYFDSIARGFPTPNESSLRTGLTPGGGGSMFPTVPSPNSQAYFAQLQSGGATPSTLEFHRTALNAAKSTKTFSGNSSNNNNNNPTTDPEQLPTMEGKTSQPAVVDHFSHHDAADAANGLFMLAKGGQANSNQFTATNSNALVAPKGADLVKPTTKLSSRANEASALPNGREMTDDGSDSSAQSGDQSKPAAGKTRGKKGAAARAAAPTAGNRRKAEETPMKGTNKKAKGNTGVPRSPSPDPKEELEMEDENSPDGRDHKKMTDEEKRRNFLERNRVAALKCRQRKKQWLANLQAKVELFTSENDALTATVTQLREEIVNLKTLLLAHKDCPVSQAQGLGQLIMNGMSAGFDPHPYNIANNMALQHGGPIPQAMRR